MKKANEQKGITLVALVITIVILLILATISIQSLTNTGLFEKAKEAKEKTKNATENQAKILNEYEDELNKYVSGTTPTQKLADKVKVGDYVTYTPDALDSNAVSTLKSNLNTYSGKSDSTINSEIKRDDLKWRVLDVQNGQVRLISETPTTSKIELYGYNGYNNAVKLLDDICSTLYNNSKLASNVKNFKLEDIQDKMVEKDYSNFNSNYLKKYSINGRYYPDILLKDKIGLSEQNDLISQEKNQQADELYVEYTYWYKPDMGAGEFNNPKYFELFINNNGKSYEPYWMSTRCISAYNGYANYSVRYMLYGNIHAFDLYNSDNKERQDKHALRPIITLKSNVRLDATKSGDGSTADKALIVKE